MRGRAKLLGAAISASAAAPAWAQAQYGPWHMHSWGMGWGGGMLFGPILIVGLVILLVVLVVPFVRGIGGGGAGGRAANARDILDERYARGEIDREEYMRRRQDIDNT